MHDTAKFRECIEEGHEELKRQGKIQEQRRTEEMQEKARLRKRKSHKMKVVKEIQEGLRTPGSRKRTVSAEIQYKSSF